MHVETDLTADLASSSLRQKGTTMTRHPSIDRTAGFTLVELLVVLAIVALLAGLVGPRVLGYVGDARAKTTRVQMENLRTAVELFALDVGRFPTAEEGLGILSTPPPTVTTWRGPYIRGNQTPNDAWGRPFIYRVSADGTSFELLSFGADGKEGGDAEAADVSSRQR